MWRAVCLICDPSSLRTQMEGGDVTYQCGKCERKLPARTFDLVCFQKHSKDWRCLKCQEGTLRPSCKGCAVRPTTPVRHPVVSYLCPTCHYPPCKVYKQDKRPHNGKYRCVWSALSGKILDAKNDWTYADCNITADAPDKVTSTAAHRSESDVPKTECHECKRFKAKSDFKLDGENRIRHKRARCPVWEFPTCHGCGNA